MLLFLQAARVLANDNRVPLVRTEFPDAGGEAVFFLVNDWHSPALVHDELVESPALTG
jgi:hypothetical protein